MSGITLSLIIDDGGPVNLSYYNDPSNKHEFLIPLFFAKKFAGICRQYSVKGKFSIVPVPCGLGRLDQKMARVPSGFIKRYLTFFKQEILPSFSITPEILTHFRALNIHSEKLAPLHYLEDAYFSHLDEEEIAEYVGLALEILSNTGLEPEGVTSPWCCGLDNESNYARGIGKAFVRKLGKKECFYFLHGPGTLSKPKVMVRTPETGKVVSIPKSAPFDPFAGTQFPVTARAAGRVVKKNLDLFLSENGKKGLFREMAEEGKDIVFISHWQYLYSDGRLIGLEGLEELLKRIRKAFGPSAEYLTFEEIAEKTR